MRDLQGYRNYVYQYLDVESLDIPESLIDTWAEEGYRKIIESIRRWPFFEMTATVTTEPDVRAYAMPGQMIDVRAIEAPWQVLRYIDYHEARNKFHLYSGIVSRGSARAYSVWAGQIQIWPMPDAAEELQVDGYRRPTDWVAQGAGATPDFPEEFEDALVAWVIYRAHMHQDDTELAEVDRRDFQEILESLISREFQNPSAFPLQVGLGGVQHRALPSRLAYPWE